MSHDLFGDEEIDTLKKLEDDYITEAKRKEENPRKEAEKKEEFLALAERLKKLQLSQSRTVQCYNCNMIGHTARFCRKPIRNT